MATQVSHAEDSWLRGQNLRRSIQPTRFSGAPESASVDVTGASWRRAGIALGVFDRVQETATKTPPAEASGVIVVLIVDSPSVVCVGASCRGIAGLSGEPLPLAGIARSALSFRHTHARV